MTLIEALKSSKRFKRNGDPAWKTRGKVSDSYWYLSDEDILADDWITEEPTVSITRTQFYQAVRDAIVEVAPNLKYQDVSGLRELDPRDLVTYPIARIAMKLGLE